MSDCIFCKIIAGDAPAEIFWEDDNHIAFLSLFPNTPGFTIVVSKEHLPSYAFENTDEDLTAITLATKKVAKILDNAFEDVGRCGMFFEGFGVDHLHTKLFPMHGTADMEKWKMIEEKHKKVFFENYPGYLTSQEGKMAKREELDKIAKKIIDSQK